MQNGFGGFSTQQAPQHQEPTNGQGHPDGFAGQAALMKEQGNEAFLTHDYARAEQLYTKVSLRLLVWFQASNYWCRQGKGVFCDTLRRVMFQCAIQCGGIIRSCGACRWQFDFAALVLI